jgi:hypothetical protein
VPQVSGSVLIGGVPTAMKMTSAVEIAPPTSVVKVRRPCCWLRST